MNPPFLQPGDRVVLFDGVCKLCNGMVRFIISHDPHKRLKLASVQSPEGQALLEWFGLPTDHFNTMGFIENNRLSVRSEAMLGLAQYLDQPWPWLRVLRVVPRVIRDWAYDRVALNRYRLFGRYETCVLPDADHEGRFLGSD